MGKLQYVNRKIGGQKLGGVIAKDLLKRLAVGTTRSAALRDPGVDLDVSGKELDDEATNQITNALKVLYERNGDNVIIRLEEICLSRNLVTVQSLNALSSIIELAGPHLRDIDLSFNRLSITTENEQASWKIFLEALSCCKSLRRLDLSGNSLGRKAFEILAKTYVRQHSSSLSAQRKHSTAKDASPRDAHEGILERQRFPHPLELLPTDLEDTNDSKIMHAQPLEQTDADLAKLSLHEIAIGSTQAPDHRGLKSIPYLILDRTGMDDACAMYLSFVIAEQGLPLELLPLVPQAKGGTPSQQLLDYDQDTRCRGILYRENEAISSDGWRVLELAEQARDKREPDNDDPDDISSSDITPKRNIKIAYKANILGMASESGTTQRRYHDLGLARSKIQAEILKDGPSGSEIWHVALRMLAVGRVILLSKRKHVSSENTPGAASVKRAQPNFALEWLGSNFVGRSTGEHLTNIPVLGKQSPNLPLTTRTQRLRNEVEARAVLNASSLHASNNSEGGTFSKKSNTLQTASTSESSYRSKLLFGLSETTWGKILAYAVDENGATAERQQRAIVQWASDRDTIRKELGELGKQRANQMWMVLNGMGCLVYE